MDSRSQIAVLNKKKIAINHQAAAGVSVIEHVDLTVIYTMFTHPLLHAFLEQIGKYLFFPIAAAANVVHAVLDWRQAYLDLQTRSVVKAIVSTLAAAAIVVAVVGALAASALFALATPIIFTATLAAKTLYHAGAAIFYAIKWRRAKSPDQKAEYAALAKSNGISAMAGLVATVAVAGVFLLGKFAIAGLGIAVSAFGAGYAVYLGIRAHQAKKAAESHDASFPGEDASLLPENHLDSPVNNDLGDGVLASRAIEQAAVSGKEAVRKPVDFSKFRLFNMTGVAGQIISTLENAGKNEQDIEHAEIEESQGSVGDYDDMPALEDDVIVSESPRKGYQ